MEFLFWISEVMVTNAYVVYGSINKGKGVLKSKCLSQYEFIREITIHWINPDYMKEEKKNPKINKRKAYTSILSISMDSRSTHASKKENAAKKYMTGKLLQESGYFSFRLDTTLKKLTDKLQVNKF